jgi:hypothetical protein
MVKKLYLDGCSLTYGHGIPRENSLGNLFKVDGCYDVLDNSRPGKSNISIAVDTYRNYKEFDTIVLGFTYSARFGLEWQDQNIDFYPGFHQKGFNIDPESLDDATLQIYKYFYSVFGPPYSENLSNMLVDTLISFLKSQGKTVLAFAWEKRQISNDIFYPYIGPDLRLADGHLNIDGTRHLFNLLQDILDE